MGSKLKITFVIVGATALSTLAINASDVLRGIDGSLTGLAIDGVNGPCGPNAVLQQFGDRTICIDTYEASPGEDCPVLDPLSVLDTRTNIQAGSCAAATQPDVQPWRFVSLSQAQQLCARAGKRLPTNEEWYKAVVGLGDSSQCAVSNRNSPAHTGSAACVTPSGVHDLVGNVWEWIDEEVQNGQYNNRPMPEGGYVTLVDSDGVVLETDETPAIDFGKDYAWTNLDGVRGMIRGGFYNSGEDAGMYTLNAAVPLDFQTAGVGFRCVADVAL